MAKLARYVDFTLHTHEGADQLSVAKICGTDWQCVVRTQDWPIADAQGRHQGVYIGLDALVPVKDPAFAFLAGKASRQTKSGEPAHRIKTVRLKGKMSQGLIVPVPSVFPDEGELDTYFGLEKYEPGHSPFGANEHIRSPGAFALYHHAENGNDYPNLFTMGEAVRVTEKIHGTSWRVGLVEDGHWELSYFVGNHFHALQPDGLNLYSKIAQQHAPEATLRRLALQFLPTDLLGSRALQHLVLFGEVFGPRVQDLAYGRERRHVALFDVAVNGVYQPWESVVWWAEQLRIETVPLLFRGPYVRTTVHALRDGKSTLAGHVREGIVLTAEPEQVVPGDAAALRRGETIFAGRKTLKFVSPDYLIRHHDAARLAH